MHRGRQQCFLKNKKSVERRFGWKDSEFDFKFVAHGLVLVHKLVTVSEMFVTVCNKIDTENESKLLDTDSYLLVVYHPNMCLSFTEVSVPEWKLQNK